MNQMNKKQNDEMVKRYMANRADILDGRASVLDVKPTKKERVKVEKSKLQTIKRDLEVYEEFAADEKSSDTRREIYRVAAMREREKLQSVELDLKRIELNAETVEQLDALASKASVGKQIQSVKDAFEELKGEAGFADNVFERPPEPPAPALPSAVTAAGQPDAPSE